MQCLQHLHGVLIFFFFFGRSKNHRSSTFKVDLFSQIKHYKYLPLNMIHSWLMFQCVFSSVHELEGAICRWNHRRGVAMVNILDNESWLNLLSLSGSYYSAPFLLYPINILHPFCFPLGSPQDAASQFPHLFTVTCSYSLTGCSPGSLTPVEIVFDLRDTSQMSPTLMLLAGFVSLSLVTPINFQWCRFRCYFIHFSPLLPSFRLHSNQWLNIISRWSPAINPHSTKVNNHHVSSHTSIL